MATRIVEWKKPYTWGQAIEVTEDKVINLKLRAENNLIIYDHWDDEIYVDLQLSDEIEPTDAFPVWVNTGRVIVDNGWDKTGTIICAKTTSWDNIKLLYADDGTLWVDNGTGTFKQIYLKGDIDTIVSTLTDYIDAHDTVVSDTAPSDPYEWQLWYDTTNDALKVYNGSQWTTTWGWGGGSWDVVWPSSATDWHLAVFDWATWKLIKDWGAMPTIPSVSTITVTLTALGWNPDQTVSATWVTATNTVVVSPVPSDMADYTSAGIYCSSQSAGHLTFVCDTIPSNDIDVNVLILS